MTLDLSSKGQRNRSTATAVNKLTNPDTAPRHSMDQLGSVLGRIIYILRAAETDPEPILFCKLDIKDVFWRMVVPKADERQFCYVLPQDPTQTTPTETMIVVPKALQMGWTSSPAFFCAATETGRDIAEDLRNTQNLPSTHWKTT